MSSSRLLMTSPDLVMVNALPEMIDHMRKLLQTCPYKKAELKILAGYDTQFELTDGYVSGASMTHVARPPSGQLGGHLRHQAPAHHVGRTNDSARLPGMLCLSPI